MTAPHWTVRFAEDAADDQELIAEHLFDACRAFGESPQEARHHAETGARQVRVLAVSFGGQSHQRHMLVRLLQKPVC